MKDYIVKQIDGDTATVSADAVAVESTRLTFTLTDGTVVASFAAFNGFYEKPVDAGTPE